MKKFVTATFFVTSNPNFPKLASQVRVIKDQFGSGTPMATISNPLDDNNGVSDPLLVYIAIDCIPGVIEALQNVFDAYQSGIDP